MSKRIILIILSLFILVINSNAQDKLFMNIGGTFVNSYVVRGVKYGKSSFQPDVTLSYKGAFFNIWSSIPFDNSNFKEFDITIGYKHKKGFSAIITDYYIAYPEVKNGDDNYFNLKKGHSYEAQIGYEIKYFSMKWYTTFAGADGVNKNGKRAYTSFLQLSVPLYLQKFNLTFDVGATPWSTTSFSTDRFAVTDLSVTLAKDIFIHKYFTIPIFAKAGVNPHLKDPYFVVGIRFSCNALQ